MNMPHLNVYGWTKTKQTKKKHHKSDNEAIVLYVNTGLNV